MRVLRLHATLLIALALVIGVAALTPSGWRWPTRVAVGWDVGVAVYLIVSVIRLIGTRSTQAIRARAAALDDAGAAVLPLSLAAALASIGIVIGETALSDRSQAGVTAALVLTTVALSWTFVHLIFAQHYAHGFYAKDDDGNDRGGLIFPGEDAPDYWDFIHFALIIGVAGQTADIQISDRRLRRLSSIHSVTAFVFNTVILALAVNFAVGLLGS